MLDLLLTPNSMKYIGVTGGIGSGKSVVCKVFECLHIAVYYSDYHAKRLMHTNQTIREKLIGVLGASVYVNNQLQTHVIAQALFADESIKKTIESIVHPIVRNDFFEWAQKQSSPYVIMESALMFQHDLYTYFDAIIYVQANDDIRTQRVMQRDGLTPDQIQARMNMQPLEEICLQKSQFVIENNNTFVIPQVIEIHRNICL